MSTEELQQDSSLADDLAANIVESPDEELDAAPEQQLEPEPELEALEPPPKWDKRYKEVFAEWGEHPNGRNWQETVLDLYNNDQAYATKVEQERAEFRKQLEQAQPFVSRMQEALTPYQQMMAELGAPPEAFVRQGLGLLQSLRNNPRETLMRIARDANVDLSKELSEQPWQSPESKAVEDLRRELNQMRQQDAMRQRYDAEQRMQRIQQENASQITAFASAADDNGDPLHPHFDQVADIMTELIYGRNSLRQSNPDLPVMGLDEAYERACKLSPEIAQTTQSKSEADRLAQAAAKAKQAKSAAKTVKSGTAGSEPLKQSLRESIEQSLVSAE